MITFILGTCFSISIIIVVMLLTYKLDRYIDLCDIRWKESDGVVYVRLDDVTYRFNTNP